MVGLFDRDMEGWMWLGYLIETWRGGCGWVRHGGVDVVGLFDRDMEGWMWLGYLIETWRGGCGWVI